MAKRKKPKAAELEKPVEVLSPDVPALEPLSASPPEEPKFFSSSLAPLTSEPSRPQAVDFNTPRSVAHDNQAGVRLLKFEKFKQFQLQVPPDAPAEIFQELRDKGWTYRPDEKVYTKQYGDQGAGPTYVEARRLYQDLCQQLSPSGQAIPY